MDNRTPDTDLNGAQNGTEDGEEIEITREELVAALQEVVTKLSNVLKEKTSETDTTNEYMAENEWFFAGASDRPDQYAITMWPAEGEEDMLRIDLGTESDVHTLAADPEQVSALTDDFIDGMSEEYDDEEFDEDDEELEEDEEFDEEDDEDMEEEDLNGASPKL